MIYRKKYLALFFIAPGFLFLLVFVCYPFLMNIYNSFFEIDVLGAPIGKWNNFENYKMLFTDPDMITSIKNTFLLMVLVILFQGGIALLLALLVDFICKGAQLYRVIFFFPMVISAAALGLIFNLLYLYPDGPLNAIITSLGFDPIIWKGEGNAFAAIAIPTIWSNVGFYFVIYVMGINNIPSDIMEAAQIDGAVGIKKIRYLTLPLLYNVLTTTLILMITGALRVFDMAWILLPNGQPGGSTYLTGTYMYQMTFINRNVDYGATIAVFIVILGILFSQLTNKIFKPKDY